MKRTIAIVAALAMGLLAPSAQADITKDAAFTFARDFVAPTTSPDYRRVTISVRRCHALPKSRWTGCRVIVRGAVTCNLVMHVRVQGDDYLGWIPRSTCSARLNERGADA